MDRSLTLHAVLAIVAAGAAYFAWSSPRAGTSNKTVMIAGDPDQLTKISWHEEKWDVAISRNDDDVRVRVQRLSPAEEPKPNDAAPKATVVPPEPAKTYPGSKQAKKLFAKFAPLEAARSLGTLGSEKLKPLGLDTPSAKLTLHFGERTTEVQIGNSTYGSGDMYTRVPDGEIFLVSSGTLSALRHGASTLLDRSAIAVAREDIEKMNISVGSRRREVVQRFPEEKAKAFFADPAEPDAKLEMVGNWFDRVSRLRVVDQVDEKPSGAPAVVIELIRGSDTLSLFKLWAPSGKTAIATSTRFEKRVTVSKASANAIIKDLESVLEEGR